MRGIFLENNGDAKIMQSSQNIPNIGLGTFTSDKMQRCVLKES